MARIPIGAVAVTLFCANAFAQSVGAKLDHVEIAVHDLEAAKSLYSRLGFSISENGRHPTGTANALVYFRDGYLELITPYDTSLSGGRGIAEDLKQGEGGKGAGLQIASADQAARELRAAGMKINGPTPGTIMMAGQKDPPPTSWWIVSFADQLASRPLWLIQYAFPAWLRDLSPPENPNSAFSLSTLLIAVNDLRSSIAGYGRIGKASDRDIRLPEFGAVGKEIVLERGRVVLLRATDPSGPTARRLKEQGEGILAVRLAATDLDQVREQIGQRDVAKDKQSVLVSPENAAGVWLEFEAARPR